MLFPKGRGRSKVEVGSKRRDERRVRDEVEKRRRRRTKIAVRSE